jgi:hypothetical protein
MSFSTGILIREARNGLAARFRNDRAVSKDKLGADHRHASAWHRHRPAGFRYGSISVQRAGAAPDFLTNQIIPMNKDDKYTLLALPLLPFRLNALEAAWYLGFQPHEISILTGAGMLEPLGHPPANTPKYFSTESLAELRDNQKWLEKATDAISTRPTRVAELRFKPVNWAILVASISRQNKRNSSRNLAAEIRERRKYRFRIVIIGFIQRSYMLN